MWLYGLRCLPRSSVFGWTKLRQRHDEAVLIQDFGKGLLGHSAGFTEVISRERHTPFQTSNRNCIGCVAIYNGHLAIGWFLLAWGSCVDVRDVGLRWRHHHWRYALIGVRNVRRVTGEILRGFVEVNVILLDLDGGVDVAIDIRLAVVGVQQHALNINKIKHNTATYACFVPSVAEASRRFPEVMHKWVTHAADTGHNTMNFWTYWLIVTGCSKVNYVWSYFASLVPGRAQWF